MLKEKRIRGVFVLYGVMKGFGLGIHISRHQFSLDFICLFIQIEF